MKQFFLFFILLFGYVSVSTAQNKGIATDRLLVMLKAERNTSTLTTELAYLDGIKTGLHLKETLSRSLRIYSFQFDNRYISSEQLLKTIQLHPFVLLAQLDHPVSPRAVPNDPSFDYLWNMQNTGQNGGIPGADIHAPQAWDLATGGLTADGDSIVIAVVDYGFDLTHPDLNYWKNYKEIPGNGLDDDQNGYVDDFDGWNTLNHTDDLPVNDHGTHVCGIAGAKGNNALGITGVNWNVQLMPVSYGGTTGFESNVIAAYAYILEQRRLYNQSKGAKGTFVITTNSSFGIDSAKAADHPLWCAMYDSLGAQGILNVGATNNYNNVNVDIGGDMPTSCESNWLIAVTNTTNRDEKSSGAAYGLRSIDLGAPGTNIASTVLSGGYTYKSGTSMATPHVSGAVALMFSAACKDLLKRYKEDLPGTSLFIKDSLLRSVNRIPALTGKTTSNGRLNLYHAVLSIKNYCEPPQPPFSEDLFSIIHIYPVPAFDQLTIDYTCDVTADICITSVLGQEVAKIPCFTNDKGRIQHMQLNLEGLSHGIYFITLRGSDKRTKSIKVVL